MAKRSTAKKTRKSTGQDYIKVYPGPELRAWLEEKIPDGERSAWCTAAIQQRRDREPQVIIPHAEVALPSPAPAVGTQPTPSPNEQQGPSIEAICRIVFQRLTMGNPVCGASWLYKKAPDKEADIWRSLDREGLSKDLNTIAAVTKYIDQWVNESHKDFIVRNGFRPAGDD
jgi:hypothetical protein